MGINFGNSVPNVNAGIVEVQTPTGIVLDLNKGAMLDLTKHEPGLKNIVLAASWDANTTYPAFDLDISAFMLNDQGKITSVEDVIFFNHRDAEGIHLSQDNRTGAGDGDDELINVNLDQIPARITAIDFVINIAEAQTRRQTFGMVQNSMVKVLNADKGNAPICQYCLKDDYSSSTGVVIARLKRNGPDWAFEAVGDGKVVRDLNDICALYM